MNFIDISLALLSFNAMAFFFFKGTVGIAEFDPLTSTACPCTITKPYLTYVSLKDLILPVLLLTCYYNNLFPWQFTGKSELIDMDR